MWRTVLAEAPFRRLTQFATRLLPVSVRTREHWNAADRPHYLTGVLYAADQAARQGFNCVAVVEFGVAEGDGLVALQTHAAAVERETGVRVAVYGFDRVAGLPAGTGDYRDHPDWWQPGDYPMDLDLLRARLTDRTTLVLGDVAETVAWARIREPLGFVSLDLDLYSSTTDALALLRRPDIVRLHRVAIYLDDAHEHYNHCFAGELLALAEFNETSADVKIDRWRGLRHQRPFGDAGWIDSMYLAHDLAALSQARAARPPARMR